MNRARRNGWRIGKKPWKRRSAPTAQTADRPPWDARESPQSWRSWIDRYDEARLLQEKSLDAYRLNLGDEHPDTLVAEFNLALNLSQSGFARDAIPLGAHVYEDRRRIFGPEAKETQSAEPELLTVPVAFGGSLALVTARTW